MDGHDESQLDAARRPSDAGAVDLAFVLEHAPLIPWAVLDEDDELAYFERLGRIDPTIRDRVLAEQAEAVAAMPGSTDLPAPALRAGVVEAVALAAGSSARQRQHAAGVGSSDRVAATSLGNSLSSSDGSRARHRRRPPAKVSRAWRPVAVGLAAGVALLLATQAQLLSRVIERSDREVFNDIASLLGASRARAVLFDPRTALHAMVSIEDVEGSATIISHPDWDAPLFVGVMLPAPAAGHELVLAQTDAEGRPTSEVTRFVPGDVSEQLPLEGFSPEASPHFAVIEVARGVTSLAEGRVLFASSAVAAVLLSRT